jgi:hypothetical protein
MTNTTTQRSWGGTLAVAVAVAGIIALFVVMALLGTALALGAANAWLLGGDFAAGWAAVWAKPVVAIGWSLLFGGAGFTVNNLLTRAEQRRSRNRW